MDAWETLQAAVKQRKENPDITISLYGFLMVLDRWPDSCEAAHALHAIKEMKKENDQVRWQLYHAS